MNKSDPKKVTVYDVAKLAKVGQSTVTRALNEWKRSSIKPETRARVLAAAAELGYHPSPMAQQLASRKSRVVYLIQFESTDVIANPIGTPDINLSQNDMLSGASSVLEMIGYRVIPFHGPHSREAEAKLLGMFRAAHFEGALFPHTAQLEFAEQLAREGCLVVSGGQPSEELPNFVQIPPAYWKQDRSPLVMEVLRQGRTRLLFTFPVPEPSKTALTQQVDSGRIQFEYMDKGETPRAVYVKSVAEYTLSNSMDAVLTLDEFLGWEVYRELNKIGIDVPDRVTITGTADVRHIFKPLPILQLMYADKVLYLREMATKLVEMLAEQNRADFAPSRQLNQYAPVLQVLSPTEFVAAARAELRREHLLQQMESQVLG